MYVRLQVSCYLFRENMMMMMMMMNSDYRQTGETAALSSLCSNIQLPSADTEHTEASD